MDGQINMFHETYPYWQGKELPKKIDAPKLIIVRKGFNYCYWQCPTCKTKNAGDLTEKEVLYNGEIIEDVVDRCKWCGQRLYWDDEEIERQPYYIKQEARIEELWIKEQKKLHGGS